jgi:endonuclease/exonuclease/phosphatase family metal-dependent hydrolase
VVRLLTYNIWDGGKGRLDEIAALVRHADADAVALLEATKRASVEHLVGVLDLELVFGEAHLGAPWSAGSSPRSPRVAGAQPSRERG